MEGKCNGPGAGRSVDKREWPSRLGGELGPMTEARMSSDILSKHRLEKGWKGSKRCQALWGVAAHVFNPSKIKNKQDF